MTGKLAGRFSVKFGELRTYDNGTAVYHSRPDVPLLDAAGEAVVLLDMLACTFNHDHRLFEREGVRVRYLRAADPLAARWEKAKREADVAGGSGRGDSPKKAEDGEGDTIRVGYTWTPDGTWARTVEEGVRSRAGGTVEMSREDFLRLVGEYQWLQRHDPHHRYVVTGPVREGKP